MRSLGEYASPLPHVLPSSSFPSNNSINIGFNCSIAFPDNFERTLSSLKIANLDFIPALGLQCALEFNYTHKVLAVTLGPLFVAAVLGVVQIILTHKAKESLAKERAWQSSKFQVRVSTYKVPEGLMRDDEGSAMNGKCNRFEPSEVEKLKLAFAVADVDGSGSIDKAELEKMEKALKMTREGDAGEDGDITFGEFMLIIHRARQKRESSNFSDLLDKMDASLVKKSVGTSVEYLFLLLTFLVLISSSTVLFHFFKCDAFDVPEEDGGGTVSFLAKDLSLNCDSDRYKIFVGYVVIMILVYPIGR